MNINTFTESLKPVYIHDHLVHMKNGKAYRVYRCGSDRAVYEYMSSNGFDTKEIVRIDIVAPKWGVDNGKKFDRILEREREKENDR